MYTLLVLKKGKQFCEVICEINNLLDGKFVAFILDEM